VILFWTWLFLKQKEQAMIKSTNDTLSSSRFSLFGDYPERFRQYLSQRNYAESTIARYLHYVSILAGRMEAERIPVHDLDEAQAEGLIAGTGHVPRTKIYVTFVVRRFVQYLNEHGVGKLPLPPTAKELARAELRRDFETYLRRQRGLSERTISKYWIFADRFLEFHFGENVGNLSQIRPTDIVEFLQHLATRKTQVDKNASSYLRAFARYLFMTGKTTTNLALLVPTVARRYGARLPRHLTPEQVDILLKAVRSCRTTARRDYAMVLLQARLGLRAPEVVAMQLDDIDWRSGEIMIRGKGDRHDRLPLPQDVGKAIADYIKLDRVTKSRVLFVTHSPPHRPFKHGGVLNLILREAFARTGLKSPVPYVGSHVLRHSLAVGLVRKGASIEEIADILRHRRRSTTLLYARLDVDGLRTVAQPWPVAGGAQ
jgi:integrase/recombinase XerD